MPLAAVVSQCVIDVTKQCEKIQTYIDALTHENRELKKRLSTYEQGTTLTTLVDYDLDCAIPCCVVEAGALDSDTGKVAPKKVSSSKARAWEEEAEEDSGNLILRKLSMLKNDPFRGLADSEKKFESLADVFRSLGGNDPLAPFIERVASSVIFITLTTLAIVANTVYLGQSADMNVKNSYRRVQGLEQDGVSDLVDILFLLWFTVEILVRAFAEKRKFVFGEDKAWNLFDVLLIMETFVSLIFETGGKLSFLRIFRVFRLVRFVRVVRTVKALRKLRNMIFALLNSFVDLLWAFMMIFIIIFVFGIIFGNAVASYFDVVDLADAEAVATATAVQKEFGSLLAAMIALWSAVSGGNDWMYYGELLRSIEGGGLYFALFNFYIAFCAIGLFNVVTGVFVDSAVCSRTEDEVVRSYLDDLSSTVNEIKALFERDSKGSLKYSEFMTQMEIPTVKAYFSGLNLDPDEASIMFTILDSDKNNELVVDEFAHGLMKLKGNASKLDFLTMMYDSAKQNHKFDNFFAFIKKELSGIHAKLQS